MMQHVESTNAQITRAFLAEIEEETRAEILANIAAHYGISPEDAFREVTDDEAEHLLDYVTGPLRAATRVLMQRDARREPTRTGMLGPARLG